jgi:hypothetical protein
MMYRNYPSFHTVFAHLLHSVHGVHAGLMANHQSTRHGVHGRRDRKDRRIGHVQALGIENVKAVVDHFSELGRTGTMMGGQDGLRKIIAALLLFRAEKPYYY